MPLELEVLIWSIAVPVVIAAGAIAVGCASLRFVSLDKLRGDVLVFALGWWASIAAALYGRQGWPEAEWQLFLWPLLAWAICVWLNSIERTSQKLNRTLCWLLFAIAAGLTSLACLPRGEAWVDSYHLHGPWGILLTLSMLVNACSLECMSRRETQRWVLLVALASFGGPVALAAATYGSLTEWAVAMVFATIVFAGAAFFVTNNHVCAIAPLSAASAICVIAAGRFQTFEEYPHWMYGMMLLLPTLVATIDFILRARSTWLRVLVASVVCFAMVGHFIWYLLIRETQVGQVAELSICV